MKDQRLKIIGTCPACKTMIETYDGVLINSGNWLKRLWQAHKYKDHKLK